MTNFCSFYIEFSHYDAPREGARVAHLRLILGLRSVDDEILERVESKRTYTRPGNRNLLRAGKPYMALYFKSEHYSRVYF